MPAHLRLFTEIWSPQIFWLIRTGTLRYMIENSWAIPCALFVVSLIYLIPKFSCCTSNLLISWILGTWCWIYFELLCKRCVFWFPFLILCFTKFVSYFHCFGSSIVLGYHKVGDVDTGYHMLFVFAMDSNVYDVGEMQKLTISLIVYLVFVSS